MRRLLAGISLLLLTGLRDPFQPPEDPCRASELAAWRYQGLVSRDARFIGIVQDSAQKWRRVERNEVLADGWRLSRLTAQEITLIKGTECEPLRLRRQRQGDVNETMDSRGADGRHLRSTGGKSAERHAGGG